LVPNLISLAKTSDDSVRLESVNIAGQVQDLNNRIQKTIGYRTQINYPYWKTLTQAEQEERTVNARRLIYEAEQANDNAELDQAIELYEQAFVLWAEIFDDYPLLTIDDTAEDLFTSVRRYMVAIDSQEIPENFPLATFVTMMGEFGQVDSTMYEAVRRESKEAAEQRRMELEEEENKRRDAAEKAEASESNSTTEPAKKETAEESAAKESAAKGDDQVDEAKPQPESSVNAASNNDAPDDENAAGQSAASDTEASSDDK
ncbi:IRE (iron responsive element), partial [Rhodopirellula sp.]|nr:IRE (iron responsive element) [Rhodopirellula sp.]